MKAERELSDVEFDRDFKELKDALQLDKFNLDQQLVEHATLFSQVADWLAFCTSDREEAEGGLATAEAEADAAIRANAAAAGEKITETAIKKAVMLDRGVMLLKDRVDRAKLAVHRLQGLKDAYIERRHAFSKLADLYGNQYWSEHSGVARGGKVARDVRRERITDTIKRRK